MPHVDDGTLHALLDGALRAEDPESAAATERHLAGCQDCRARLTAAAELRDDAGAILDHAAPTATAPAPNFGEVLARAGAGKRRRLGGQARWTRRVAWAASVVVALGTGYLIRDLSIPAPPSSMSPSSPRSTLPSAPAAAPSPAPSPEGRVQDSAAGDEADAAATGAPGPTGTSASDRAAAPQRDGNAGAAEMAAEDGVAEGPAVVGEPGVANRTLEAEEERISAATAAAPPSASLESVGLEPASLASGSGAAAGAVDPATMVWSITTLPEARRALDGPIYLLPRATLLEVSLSGVGEPGTPPRVRSRQRLESGVAVEVVQWRGEAEAVYDRAAATQPERVERTGQVDRPGTSSPDVARVVRGPWVLEVTGTLPVELLAILAESATPAR